MIGGSASRFATLALSLFLSSNDQWISGEASAFVESFQLPSQTIRIKNIGTYPVVGQEARQGFAYDVNYPQSRFRLNAANPKSDTKEKLRNPMATSKSLPSSRDLAEAERAWALDSPIEERDESFKLLSADVLGPVFSVLFVVAFLFFTLLNSGGISDTFLSMNLEAKLNVLSKISWFPGTVQESQVAVGLVMAFSAFAQALTGFGFAVVAVGALSSMSWLLHSELYEVITPVAATLGALVGFILLIPYAFAEGPPTEDEPGLDWSEILPLLIPCTILTPLGVQLNSMVDPILATRVLAALIMGFVGYKLVPTTQENFGNGDASGDEIELVDVSQEGESSDFLQSRAGAILLGSAAGIFGGAFDVQGPPLCIYGDAKGWSPAKFRNTVLAVVCLNSAFVVAIDFFEGALGDFYYSYFCLTSLPGVLLGIVAGQYASERIDPVLFKNIVLVMCLGLGIQLLGVS